jgi:glycosyltransferase involved in cell wall biosynthesis
MERKPKVSIVAGDLRLPRLLGLFEGLRDDFDPTVFVLNNPHTINHHGTGLKMKVFDNIPEMPGYMRDLEEHLDNSDFIVSFETSKLATFQAVRIARKLGVPCGIVVNEYQPFFYEGYQNIRAVQHDVIEKADIFWPTTSQAANTLVVDGVTSNRISRVNVPIDLDRFKYQSAARLKFRNYIGLKENETVILVKAAIEPWTNISSLLQAFSLVKKRGTFGARNVKLLIAGDGTQSKDLKYKTFDLGIGGHVMFLHQDSEPFLKDMYCASDLVFDPKMTKSDFLPDMPAHIAEAMACSVVPLVIAGSISAELAGDSGFVCADGSPESIAAVLQTILLEPSILDKKRLHTQRRCHEIFDLTIQSQRFKESLQHLLANQKNPGDQIHNLLDKARSQLHAGKDRDALISLEECKIIGLKTSGDRVQWNQLRGDVFYGLGEMDEATNAYSEGVRIDEKSLECLRGLGFVSWKGHSNEEAMIFFRKALALKHDDRKSQYGIGMIFRRLGLLEDSLFWLEQSMLGPERPESAVVVYSQTCIQMNRPEKAAKRIEMTLDKVGDHPTLLMTLSQLYMSMGRSQEAQDIMTRAGNKAG